MSKINKILIPILFFTQYLGIGYPAQVIILLLLFFEITRGKRILISQTDSILLLSLLILFFVKFFSIPYILNILIFKFYWGFIIFYLYFKLTDFKIDYLKLFWIMVFVTTIEFMLINSIVSPGFLGNINNKHAELMYNQLSFTQYNRAYGLAGIPTGSATILVALLASIYTLQRKYFKNYLIYVAALPLVLIASGTGYVLYIVFVFIRFKLYKNLNLILGILFIILIYYFFSRNSISEESVFQRLSLDYYGILVELKLQQVIDVYYKLDHSIYETLFGYNYRIIDSARLLSDFGWIDFLECQGVFGVFLLLLFLILKKKLLFLPILIVLLGSFHYTSLGSIPGQILFASLLSFNPQKYNRLVIFQNKNNT